MIKNKPNCRRLQRTADEDRFFFKKVLNGDIIEATIEGGQLLGTDITRLDSNYLYVCHYPYESVDGLLETGGAEILII